MLLSSVSAARQVSRQASSSSFIRCLTTLDTPHATSSKPASSTDHYRITLRRSAIGLTEKTKGTLASLGLRKRLQSVYLPQRSDIAGMILAVKELVHVENVKQLVDSTIEDDENDNAMQADIWLNEKGEVVDWGGRQARKAPRGYTVVGNISNALRNEEILAQNKEEPLQ